MIKDLVDRELIINWPTKKRPILKEFIYLPDNFLITLKWIELRYSNESGEQYFIKNENQLLKKDDKANDRQILFYDRATLQVSDVFVNTIKYNRNNKNGSKQIEGYQSFYPMRFTSLFKPIFTSVPFDSRYEYFYISNGTFEDFQKINYNELPKNLSSKKIYFPKAFLDYHFHRKIERNLFDYDGTNSFKLKELKDQKLSYYICADFYTDHVGRFDRWVENIWLMFLKARDSNGDYYYPYRMIQKNAYHQDEETFYAIEKSKLANYFQLDPKDNDYLVIFKKMNEETNDAKVVWLSNVLLGKFESDHLVCKRLIELFLFCFLI